MTGPPPPPPGEPSGPTGPGRASTTLRGSFVTHIAAYCAPCDLHWRRPRLHRYAVDNVHGSVTA